MTILISSSGSGVHAPLGRDAANDRLVVMTYNIGGRSLKKAAGNKDMSLAHVIGKQSPDIVFLQETREQDCVSLADALGMKDFFYIPYRKKGRSGLAILSMYPLSKTRAHFFPASPNGLGYVMSEVVVGENVILLVNLHLDRNERVRARKAMPRVPWKTAFGVMREELFEETTRYKQVGMILDRIESGRRQTTIMAGDFNTIPYGTAVRKVRARFDDALWPSLAYFSNTFREIGFPLKPRIDYIFHSPEIHTTKSGVIRSGPGDHYPVWAEFGIGGNGDGALPVRQAGLRP